MVSAVGCMERSRILVVPGCLTGVSCRGAWTIFKDRAGKVEAVKAPRLLGEPHGEVSSLVSVTFVVVYCSIGCLTACALDNIPLMLSIFDVFYGPID